MEPTRAGLWSRAAHRQRWYDFGSQAVETTKFLHISALSFLSQTPGSAPRRGESHRRWILLRFVGWVPP